MILISLPLALIAIVFGAKLLAQSQKENLGGLYKFLSWFVIVVGILIMLCDGTHSCMRMCHHGDGMMMNRECMMGGMNDRCMMGGGGDCQMMMHCNRGNMCCGNCCGGMMNCGGNSNCSDGMMNCKDGGKGGASCSDGGMNGTSCPMGNMKDKKDTAKAKK